MPVNCVFCMLHSRFSIKYEFFFCLHNFIAGENGETVNGYNSVGSRLPEIVPFRPIQFLNGFTDNMSMATAQLFRKSYFQEFLTQLNESQTIRSLIDKYRGTVVTEFDSTENQDQLLFN